MSRPDKFFRINGMIIILDLQGFPENVCKEMKQVVASPWLSLQKKVKWLQKIHDNYLTPLQNKSK